MIKLVLLDYIYFVLAIITYVFSPYLQCNPFYLFLSNLNQILHATLVILGPELTHLCLMCQQLISQH